jgi:hypothetical protein
MASLYPYVANLASTPAYVPYPLNPLPRLVFPQDTTAGNEGMSLYSSADRPLQIACDATQIVNMQVAHVPTVAGLSVNRVGPPTTSDSLVWLKAVPLVAAQTDTASIVPTTLLDAVPSAWHSSDAWDTNHVSVDGTGVKVTLAPKCSRSGSTGLQMVCLQVSYALDDVCMDSPAGPCLHPSNYGCRLENPDTPGRCYAMSAPSRCLYYTVTNPAATAMPRHTAPPVPQATPPPPPPLPPPSQPVIEAVEEEPPTPAAESHITHVLDLPAHLEDPQVQIQRSITLLRPLACCLMPCMQRVVQVAARQVAARHVLDIERRRRKYIFLHVMRVGINFLGCQAGVNWVCILLRI